MTEYDEEREALKVAQSRRPWDPAPLSIVRSPADAECIAALEQLLDEAKRGEFDSILCFAFKELPVRFNYRFKGNMPSEAVALLAVEVWKHELLAAKAKDQT